MKKNEAEFDRFAGTYNEILDRHLSFLNRDTDYFAEYKIVKIYSLFKKMPKPKRILDFGCGTGRSIPYIKAYFPEAEIFGCDISMKSLQIAAESFTYAKFQLVEEMLESESKSFDHVFVAGILHHVPSNERQKVLSSVASFMKRGATVSIFEHNPLNPFTTYLVKTCPFDENASLLRRKETENYIKQVPMRIFAFGYTLFFPEFLRLFRRLEPYIEFLPLGGQYYVCAEKI